MVDRMPTPSPQYDTWSPLLDDSSNRTPTDSGMPDNGINGRGEADDGAEEIDAANDETFGDSGPIRDDWAASAAEIDRIEEFRHHFHAGEGRTQRTQSATLLPLGSPESLPDRMQPSPFAVQPRHSLDVSDYRRDTGLGPPDAPLPSPGPTALSSPPNGDARSLSSPASPPPEGLRQFLFAKAATVAANRRDDQPQPQQRKEDLLPDLSSLRASRGGGHSLLELTATPSSAPSPPHVPDADPFQRRQPRADGGQLASPSTSPPPGTSPPSALSIGMNIRQMLPSLAEHTTSPSPTNPPNEGSDGENWGAGWSQAANQGSIHEINWSPGTQEKREGSGPAPISPFFGAMSPLGGSGLPAVMMEARGEQPPTRLGSWPAAAEGGSVGAGPARVPSMPHATPEPLPPAGEPSLFPPFPSADQPPFPALEPAHLPFASPSPESRHPLFQETDITREARSTTGLFNLPSDSQPGQQRPPLPFVSSPPSVDRPFMPPEGGGLLGDALHGMQQPVGSRPPPPPASAVPNPPFMLGPRSSDTSATGSRGEGEVSSPADRGPGGPGPGGEQINMLQSLVHRARGTGEGTIQLDVNQVEDLMRALGASGGGTNHVGRHSVPAASRPIPPSGMSPPPPPEPSSQQTNPILQLLQQDRRHSDQIGMQQQQPQRMPPQGGRGPHAGLPPFGGGPGPQRVGKTPTSGPRGFPGAPPPPPPPPGFGLMGRPPGILPHPSADGFELMGKTARQLNMNMNMGGFAGSPVFPPPPPPPPPMEDEYHAGVQWAATGGPVPPRRPHRIFPLTKTHKELIVKGQIDFPAPWSRKEMPPDAGARQLMRRREIDFILRTFLNLTSRNPSVQLPSGRFVFQHTPRPSTASPHPSEIHPSHAGSDDEVPAVGSPAAEAVTRGTETPEEHEGEPHEPREEKPPEDSPHVHVDHEEEDDFHRRFGGRNYATVRHPRQIIQLAPGVGAGQGFGHVGGPEGRTNGSPVVDERMPSKAPQTCAEILAMIRTHGVSEGKLRRFVSRCVEEGYDTLMHIERIDEKIRETPAFNTPQVDRLNTDKRKAISCLYGWATGRSLRTEDGQLDSDEGRINGLTAPSRESETPSEQEGGEGPAAPVRASSIDTVGTGSKAEWLLEKILRIGKGQRLVGRLLGHLVDDLRDQDNVKPALAYVLQMVVRTPSFLRECMASLDTSQAAPKAPPAAAAARERPDMPMPPPPPPPPPPKLPALAQLADASLKAMQRLSTPDEDGWDWCCCLLGRMLEGVDRQTLAALLHHKGGVRSLRILTERLPPVTDPDTPQTVKSTLLSYGQTIGGGVLQAIVQVCINERPQEALEQLSRADHGHPEGHTIGLVRLLSFLYTQADDKQRTLLKEPLTRLVPSFVPSQTGQVVNEIFSHLDTAGGGPNGPSLGLSALST
ncbi:unnamed protein product [Vitrella brassicaformis CCMP3155]|uniref:Uncharacterized protein n=2 Tax=Vitrella brassicaformis TaxID=1169539 RepID=A0A0G4FFY0_VITBC|nr:unnamed protein product [Vitrella brassicaformis CCMP3155]|eukprot:CEM12078.1 unnamed protein product [Vitrella brassicaformis CCMP3155]